MFSLCFAEKNVVFLAVQRPCSCRFFASKRLQYSGQLSYFCRVNSECTRLGRSTKRRQAHPDTSWLQERRRTVRRSAKAYDSCRIDAIKCKYPKKIRHPVRQFCLSLWAAARRRLADFRRLQQITREKKIFYRRKKSRTSTVGIRVSAFSTQLVQGLLRLQYNAYTKFILFKYIAL